jgi:pimeloyl-ACP methyl ester carboxylesterase
VRCDLPAAAALTFRAECRRLLPPERFAEVDELYTSELLAARVQFQGRIDAGATMPHEAVLARVRARVREQRDAWQVLEAWDRPTVIAFSDSDPVTKGGDGIFNKIAGTVGQPHTTIVGGGHFLQEDQGPQLAQVVIDLVERTPDA